MTANSTATDTSALPFSSLALSADMLTTLKELGYETMTPIQAESLPSLLAGRDVIAQAKTGSGKTAAFGIGLLSHLDARRLDVQALVLCPTRELADQVSKELRRLARALGNVKILSLCGGASIGPQIGSLEFGAHIIVGTPGRVLKHLEKETLSVKHLRTLVLDEADRMLDMGFYESLKAITQFLPERRQTLMFSATYAEGIRALSGRFQNNPVEITVESVHTESAIEQVFFEVDPKARLAAINSLLRHYQPESAVLFCNTKQRCDDVLTGLREQGFHAAALHGDLEQRERDQVLVQFANQSCPVLIATDVAARGLDIKGLAMVINVELAFDPEIHIHRIGRTGRAGENGLALSLCAPAESNRASAVEDYQQQPLIWQSLPTVSSLAKIPAPRRVTIQILAGRKDKLRAGDIVGGLTGDGAIAGTKIGKIDVFDLQSYVAVDREVSAAAIRAITEVGIKGRRFKARVMGR